MGNAADHALENFSVSDEMRRQIYELYRQYDSGFISYEDEHAEIADILGVPLNEWQQALSAENSINQKLLGFAKDLPCKRGILSNIGKQSMQRLKQETDLSFFDDILISADAGVLKPEPEIFHMAAERLGVPVGECVFIDDLPSNVSGATAVGMQGIVFENTAQTIKKLEVLLAD